jgi:hypothetical protein
VHDEAAAAAVVRVLLVWMGVRLCRLLQLHLHSSETLRPRALLLLLPVVLLLLL